MQIQRVVSWGKSRASKRLASHSTSLWSLVLFFFFHRLAIIKPYLPRSMLLFGFLVYASPTTHSLSWFATCACNIVYRCDYVVWYHGTSPCLYSRNFGSTPEILATFFFEALFFFFFFFFYVPRYYKSEQYTRVSLALFFSILRECEKVLDKKVQHSSPSYLYLLSNFFMGLQRLSTKNLACCGCPAWAHWLVYSLPLSFLYIQVTLSSHPFFYAAKDKSQHTT